MLATKEVIGNKDSCTVLIGLEYCSLKKNENIKRFTLWQ